MSDIDIAVVDSLKALDPKRPIREADIRVTFRQVGFGPIGDIDQGRVSLLNGHSESRVTGLEFDAATTRDKPERPPAPAC